MTLFLLLGFSGSLAAGKLFPQKAYLNQPPKLHPHTGLLSQRQIQTCDSKDDDFDRLLVILVDFPTETPDDPLTTGNGKFLLQPDPTYLYSVGSPPHDRPYFLNNLEALRYYYLAASYGSYNLQYDVFPSTGAYTLPQPMSYYNPPGADATLFVSRMEEYFKESFELADSLSPEIDFASYGHYMIIHAGSDWQHDLNGDTPSDIPSFFIAVGAGKEASVDEGSVQISHACNVPSTISQDFDSNESDGETFHSGYGALNAVLAHEFAHSLGMADLYNVYNWQPMVGVFDIMDSGGSGVLVDVLEDGSYVLVEGALPVLPGAWSRALVFGGYLQSSGYLKDLEQLPLFEQLSLSAASSRQIGNTVLPAIIRLPLSPSELVLVENRNVDPDGDGGTAVFATDDSRVILYPTPINDPANTPSYEYDYLLPSFQKANGDAIGGGVLVWRINNSVIYEQGVTDAEGNWISNFANNSINTRYAERGVEIIEADNLPDIGYDWSWYWTGTQYEYFHRNRPVLDGSGYFVNWSQDQWKPTLSGITEPPLCDSQGFGSEYWLSEISHPGAVMSLKVNSGFFSATQILRYGEPGLFPGPLINSSFSQKDLPLISQNSIRLLSQEGIQWVDLMGEFDWDGSQIDFPVVSTDQNANGYRELVMVHGNSVELVEFPNDTLLSRSFNFSAPAVCAPLDLGDRLCVATQDGLALIRNESITAGSYMEGIKRIGANGGSIAAVCTDVLYIVEPEGLSVIADATLPEPFGAYEPVCVTGPDFILLYLMANSGNLYLYQNGILRLIWSDATAGLPTQLGVTRMAEGSAAAPAVSDPAVFWAAGSKIYAVKHDGTMISGFPYNAHPISFAPREHVYAHSLDPNYSYLYLPVPGRGHIAYSPGAGILCGQSLLSGQLTAGSQLLYDQAYPNSVFYWYYADPEGDVFIHSSLENPLRFSLRWNGFRNGGKGSYPLDELVDEDPNAPSFTAYVFPNPVRGDEFRVHIEVFNHALDYQIYDINASLVMSGSEPANGILSRDLQLDSAKLASGVYILDIVSGSRHKRLKFAVQK